MKRHEDVGRLEVTMDDSLLVRMLNGPADLNEQLEPLGGGQLVLVTVVGDADALHQFHYKERPAGVRGARIEDFGNIGMVHERQRLTLGLETRHYLLGVHAQLNDLE